MAGKDDIETKVAAVGDLSREELASLWRKNFGCPPPKGVHKELLVRAAAFHLQQKHFGGLSGEAKRLLKAAMRQAQATMATRTAKTSSDRDGIDLSGMTAEQASASSASPPPRERQTVRAGARLIREWNGSNHVVDVIDDGFVYAGKRYRSLSKIAGEITGTNWSGPRFFGL